MRALGLVTIVALAGCDQSNSKKSDPDLVGTYQMVAVRTDPTGAEQVVVLDTRTARISTCKPAPVHMDCTMGTTAFP